MNIKQQKTELSYTFGNPLRLSMLNYRKQFQKPDGTSELSDSPVKRTKYLNHLKTSGYQLRNKLLKKLNLRAGNWMKIPNNKR